jgi:hypothetical protein
MRKPFRMNTDVQQPPKIGYPTLRQNNETQVLRLPFSAFRAAQDDSGEGGARVICGIPPIRKEREWMGHGDLWYPTHSQRTRMDEAP